MNNESISVAKSALDAGAGLFVASVCSAVLPGSGDVGVVLVGAAVIVGLAVALRLAASAAVVGGSCWVGDVRVITCVVDVDVANS